MSTEIKLPSGATVTLKDPTALRVKDRKKVLLASDAVEGTLTKALALGDCLVAMMVESWSFDGPLPSKDLSALDELELPDYDFLVEATSDAADALFPGLAKTIKNETDPNSPLGS